MSDQDQRRPLIPSGEGDSQRWTPLPNVPDAHRECSSGMIQFATRDLPPKGTVAVLGEGELQEVPLDWLTNRFDELWVHLPGLAYPPALEAIDSSRRSGWHSFTADLTGITEDFLEQVDSILETASAHDATPQLAELAQRIQVQPFRPERRFNLVIVSCILSQLHLHVWNQSLERYSARFPDAADSPPSSNQWGQAMFGLARRMEHAFVHSLAQWVEPEGRVYLANAVQGCFVRANEHGVWLTEGMFQLTETLELADYVDQTFSIEERGRWVWVTPPSVEQGSRGRINKVQGLILRPLINDNH